MKYKTHNEIEIHTKGSLLGHINTSYDKLIRTFGPPIKGNKYKIDVEWIIKFKDERVATIYNYKNGKNYLGKKGKAVENINKWYINGEDKSVIKDIKEILNNSSIKLQTLKKHKSIINTPTQDDWNTMLKCLEQYRDMLENKPNDDPDHYITIILDEALVEIPENVTHAFK